MISCAVIILNFIVLIDSLVPRTDKMGSMRKVPSNSIDLKRLRNDQEWKELSDSIHDAYMRLELPTFLSIKSGFSNRNDNNQIFLQSQVIPERKISTYYGEISIGVNPNTKFKVLFDTGSCEFWVPDDSCISPQCMGHRRYKISSSFKPKLTPSGSASLLQVEYLSGRLHGYDGFETVRIGESYVLPDTSVGFATSVEIPLLRDLEWDGIVGLGFANNEIRQRGVIPLIEHIKKNGMLTRYGEQNMLGYYLGKDFGNISFGSINNKYKRNPSDDFVWISIDPDNTYWTIKLLGIRKIYRDSKKEIVAEKFSKGGRNSIVDTGTYLIYIPPSTMRGYLHDIRLRSCQDKINLPTLVLEISGYVGNSTKLSLIELALTPDDYVLEFKTESGVQCVLGIAPDEAESGDMGNFTLGQVFLRAFYTVFDWDTKRVGFCPSLR